MTTLDNTRFLSDDDLATVVGGRMNDGKQQLGAKPFNGVVGGKGDDNLIDFGIIAGTIATGALIVASIVTH